MLTIIDLQGPLAFSHDVPISREANPTRTVYSKYLDRNPSESFSRKKGRNLGLAHITWMAFVMKQDEPSDPADIRPLGAWAAAFALGATAAKKAGHYVLESPAKAGHYVRQERHKENPSLCLCVSVDRDRGGSKEQDPPYVWRS